MPWCGIRSEGALHSDIYYLNVAFRFATRKISDPISFEEQLAKKIE